MSKTRIFNSYNVFQPAEGEPVHSAITEKDAIVVAWHIKPSQKIPKHTHFNGQDTWTNLTGRRKYYLDKAGTRNSIVIGHLVAADTGCVTGVFNSLAAAGYQLVSQRILLLSILNHLVHENTFGSR